MNSSGRTMPRSGWFQRISASAPATRPSARRTFGWIEHLELVAFERGPHLAHERETARAVLVHLVCVDLVAAARFLGRVHRDVGATQQRLGVLALGREDRDAEAARDVEREPLDRDRVAAAPRAAVRRSRTPRRRRGDRATARRTRRRRGAPSCRRRAARSTGEDRSPSGAWSPKWWPSVSLTSLKWSRSISITAMRPPRARAASIASESRCWKNMRFGSPVSESCRA